MWAGCSGQNVSKRVAHRLQGTRTTRLSHSTTTRPSTDRLFLQVKPTRERHRASHRSPPTPVSTPNRHRSPRDVASGPTRRLTQRHATVLAAEPSPKSIGVLTILDAILDAILDTSEMDASRDAVGFGAWETPLARQRSEDRARRAERRRAGEKAGQRESDAQLPPDASEPRRADVSRSSHSRTMFAQGADAGADLFVPRVSGQSRQLVSKRVAHRLQAMGGGNGRRSDTLDLTST